MVEQPKHNALKLGVFVATLCPVAGLIGMLVCGIEQGARIPFEDAALDAVKHVLGFLVSATIGHAATAEFFQAPRSQLLAHSSRRFPVVCGIAVAAAVMLVEPTTDVLGGFFGHGDENLMLAGSVIFWSSVATAMVFGIDALAFRWSAKRPQD